MAAGNRKKTSGVHFCQKRGLFSLLNFRKFRQMFLLILTLFRMLKIAGRVILKTRNSSATTILLMSRTMKIRKLKLFYCQKNARYRAKELWRDIFLGNLSLKEGKNSVCLPVLILEFWWRHVQTMLPVWKSDNFFVSRTHDIFFPVHVPTMWDSVKTIVSQDIYWWNQQPELAAIE